MSKRSSTVLTQEEPGITLSIDGQDFHLGYSRISKYQACAKQYKFNYVDGIKTESKMHMRRGNAYHDCLEQMLRFKMEKEKLASLERCLVLARYCGVKWNLTECEIRKVIDAVTYYHSGTSSDNPVPKYAQHVPLAVEEDFEIVRGGVKITGRIDLIETNGAITDHKFSADVWAEDRARYGCQPMVYQWAGEDYMSAKFGVPYGGFRYNIIRLWPSTLIQTIEIEPMSQSASDWWEEQIATIAQGIQHGIFPANAQEKECKWCDYKKLCKPCIYDIAMSEMKDNIDDFQDC